MVRGRAAWQSSALIILRPILGISLRVRAETARVATALLLRELCRLWLKAHQRLTRHACQDCGSISLSDCPAFHRAHSSTFCCLDNPGRPICAIATLRSEHDTHHVAFIR